MKAGKRERGTMLVLVTGVLALGIAAAFAAGLAGTAARLARERSSDKALAAAREALVAYAAGRPIDAIVGPGYLPCPDLDDDGWAEATCGSQNGSSGQAQRLGRLPWKTLGIPELRDAHGERLWYAVSSKHKGLLNCTVSAACVDMSPEAALGTITVRDATGAIVHDGRIDDTARIPASGAVAVVIAPGPALGAQARASAAERLDPRNYLDRAAGTAFGDEDNADFVDRNDAARRAANANGFIRGPVRRDGATLVVNDRLAVVAYDDVMAGVMRRVAQEVAQCLRAYAARSGTYPWTAPPCGDPAAAGTWAPSPGSRFGRVPAIALEACALATDESPNWWNTWRHHVFYAREVQALDAANAGGGAPRDFAILVAAAPLARLATDAAGCPVDPYFAACAPGTECTRVALASRTGNRDDFVLVHP